jgi:hypothetical protein
MKKHSMIQKLFFILLGITLLTSCGKGCQKAGGGKIDPLDIIPASHNLLISLNWKKLTETPFFSEVSNEMPAEAKELSKDVNDALISVSLRNPGEAPSALAFINGNLDEKKILPLLEESAKKQGGELKKESFEGKTIYLSPKDPNIGLLFLSPTQAVWGQLATLKESFTSTANKNPSVRSNKELIDLYNQRDSKKLLWGVATLPQNLANTETKSGDPMAALQGLKAFSLGIDYDKDLGISWTGHTQDAAQAQNLANLVNSYKTIFGASLAVQQPMWGQVIQGVQISNQEKSVNIALKINEPLVKQISQKIAEKSKQRAAAGASPGLPGGSAEPSTPSPGQAAQP